MSPSAARPILFEAYVHLPGLAWTTKWLPGAVLVLAVGGVVAWLLLTGRSVQPEPGLLLETPLAISHRFRAESWDEGLPRAGQWRQGFALADMDGDGHVDLVHGPARKGQPRPHVFRSNGSGRWEPWSSVSFPPLAYDYGDVAVADFNGDGRLDVALGIHLRGLAVLVQGAGGTFLLHGEGLPFSAAGAPVVEAPFSSRAIEVLDWNGDGRTDVAALSDGPRPVSAGSGGGAPGLRIFLNQHSRWQRAAEPGPPDRTFGDSLAVGDVDGNGRPDVVVASSTVGFKGLVRLNVDGTWRVEDLSGLPDRVLVRAVATGDLDGDRKDDVLLATTHLADGAWRPELYVATRSSSQWEVRRLLRLPVPQEAVALALRDVDGDGALDGAVGRRDGSVVLLAGDGHGGFTQDAEIEAPPWRAGCAAQHVRYATRDAVTGAVLVASFAGESDGDQARCPSGGALQAWRLVKAAE